MRRPHNRKPARGLVATDGQYVYEQRVQPASAPTPFAFLLAKSILPMFDPEELAAEDEAQTVSLQEASQAVMDVLEEAHAELAALRHRLGEEGFDQNLEVDEEELPTPREQALHVAARLEAAAGAIRGASDQGDE